MRRRDKTGRKAVKTTRRDASNRKSILVGQKAEVARLTRELKEAREQQAATGEILASIAGSVTDAKPVFDTIARNLRRLFDTRLVVVQVLKDGMVHLAAAGSDREFEQLRKHFPQTVDKNTGGGRAMLSKQVLQYVPVVGNAAAPHATQQFAREIGFSSVIFAPMMRDSKVVGALAAARREPKSFNEKEVALIKAFADQAVIAIENARLFNETKEALEQQTATSEVLRVISSSPTNVQPVFDAIAESAMRLCDGQFSFVMRFDGKEMDFASCCGLSAEGLEAFHSILPMPAGEDTASGRAIVRRAVVEIPDVETDSSYGTQGQGLAKVVTYRSIAAVPLLHEGNPIGAIAVARAEAGSFPKRQIALLQAFADQAVIAIQNVRLFDEVQARTRELSESLEQQTATSEVLQVISSSAGDLNPVFKSILENATRICEARFGILVLTEGEGFRMAAMHDAPPAFVEKRTREPFFTPGPSNILVLATRTKETQHAADLKLHRSYIEREPAAVALAEFAGARTLVVVPMLKDNEPIGAIAIYRTEVRPFSDKQVELVTNFAAQAVIAIENTRLLTELRQRTTDLSTSLENLRTTQDRLVQTQKLASLGQLTAGIAHEIKNPLNFVTNFSVVSSELIDELQDTLKGPFDERVRTEINELTNTLRSNLDKVVQHGKRADAIVKNMLLHSREGSGEHRRIDINTLVEEGLNLAYHGARAEKQGFNVKLERSFDQTVGEADVFPQDITRVLLNLISNGFYAATKRAVGTNGGDYEPTLSAATRNRGENIEISIRDNGTGIPQDVRDKIFNPFFTTKPAGEGTGLGLSISHDIIVKQHGGSIEVHTEPGEFTEIRVILPRAAALLPERS